MIIASEFWTKKSAHIVFRRPLEPDSDKTIQMEIGHSYHISLQWGLFDSPDDTDATKLRGNTKTLDEFNELFIVPVSNPDSSTLDGMRTGGALFSLMALILMNF